MRVEGATCWMTYLQSPAAGTVTTNDNCRQKHDRDRTSDNQRGFNVIQLELQDDSFF